MMINLFDLTYQQLEQTLVQMGHPKFRAQQLSDWLYKKLVHDPKLMINLPDALKNDLYEKISLTLPTIQHVARSKTDNSYKFLLKTTLRDASRDSASHFLDAPQANGENDTSHISRQNKRALDLSASLRSKLENCQSKKNIESIESILMLQKTRFPEELRGAFEKRISRSVSKGATGNTTLCVSCMIGCPLACTFCATGTEIGFIRKLTPSEIIGQVFATLQYAHKHDITDRITNIVFMGMGEPFLNRENIETAINILTDPKCFALSPSKISVSTAGVGPGIADFINHTGVRLAVSLHFPNNELRSKYMPINKRFPLEDLIAELKKIELKKRDSLLIEYLMLGGVNDSLEYAKQLHKLICHLKVKVNLIPYNPTKTLPAKTPSEHTINAFATYLRDKGIFTSVRRSRGIDVEGGCGQFALKKQ